MTTKISGRRGVVIALILALLAALAVLVVTLGGGPGEPTAGPTATGSASPVAVGPPRRDGGTTSGIEPAPAMAKSTPVSIDIPKIEAHSSLVSLGLNADNTIQVPSVNTPLQAGWYSYAPTPGETGPAVVLGHVDGNKQKGIFFRLKELAAGDRVSIARQDGTTAVFQVTKVHRVPKTDFDKEGVYDDTPGPELRLITCGGVFDHSSHNYLDNIVVYAQLIKG